MAASVNLHRLARPAVNAVHPEVTATLFRSVGRITLPDGRAKSRYAPGEAVTVQMQSEGATALYHAGRVGMEESSRKFYLFSLPGLERRVSGLVRPLARGGDMFELAGNSWWLVEAVLEDFTSSGWVCLRAVLQVIPPDFSFSEWHHE